MNAVYYLQKFLINLNPTIFFIVLFPSVSETTPALARKNNMAKRTLRASYKVKYLT